MKNKEILDLLKRDGLHEAEQATGKSYKESPETLSLGMHHTISLNKQKEKALKEIGDTTFSMKTEDYLKIVTDFGFELLRKIDFIGHNNNNESQYVMYHNKYGILLNFDTFHDTINGGNFYYNFLMPCKLESRHSLTETGNFVSWRKGNNREFNNEFNCFYDKDLNPLIVPFENIRWGIDENYEQYEIRQKEFQDTLLNPWIEANNPYRLWVGHHDCREAICLKIKSIAEHCIFIKDWQEMPFLWLLNYVSKSNNKYNVDYEKINREVIETLPVEVQNNILVK